MDRGALLLLIPPVAKPSEPTPGALALAAHLRGRGVPAAVLDLNLAFHRALWSRPSPEEPPPGPAGTRARRAASKAPEAAAPLTGPRGYAAGPAYRQALADLLLAYRVFGDARGVRVTPSDLELPGWSPLSSADLAQAAEAPQDLPIFDLLRPLAEAALARDPALIGVSATFLSQAVPAFALAGRLRRSGFRGRLVLGGALVAAWRPRLRPESPVFRAWDALVAGPGEEALAALWHGAWRAPGVLAPRRGVWEPPARPGRWEPRVDPEDLGEGYLAPGPVVPLPLSRGCYWRRCAFCPEAAQGGAGFRPAVRSGVAGALARAPGPWAHLTDEAVPPSLLRALAEAPPPGLRWYGFVRPEPLLADPALARGLARSGCRLLRVGAESASQAVLDRAGKGTDAALLGPIVRALAEAGIRTQVYLLFGLPGQTRRDAEETLDWVRRHADAVTFLNLALFHLPRGSRWEAELAARGLLGPDLPGQDLSLYRPFAEPAWPRAEVRAFLSGARDDPVIGPILRRTPPGFTANHAPFAPLGGEPN
ncbi:B12-binding domain-containing radical SAM protein [Deferrisoma palaeochoriense]